MRQLLIGFDGAGKSTFLRGWTPFIESLISQGSSFELHEDLMSRGWVEIFTGEHASVTGALYEKPLVNGTYSWTDKFELKNIEGYGEAVKPIWQVLNEHGYRVGIMNVPVTYPAPAVDGFFVSGGGGGSRITQEVAREQCYPYEIRDQLCQSGYILDERLPTLLGEKKLYEASSFFSQIDIMVERRTDNFIRLSKEFEVDFGFIVYKSSVVTPETLLLGEYNEFTIGDSEVNEEFLDAAKKYYQKLDAHVRRIVESFPGAEIVLVSDHSMAVRRYSVNLNAFLEQYKYQVRSSERLGIFRFVKIIKGVVPLSIRQLLKRNQMIKSGYESMISFNPELTKAFNRTLTRNTFGFFINDCERFGGAVRKSDVESLVDMIVDDFNSCPEARGHNLKAYKNDIKNEKNKVFFPDVMVEMPDGYVPSNEYVQFLHEHQYKRFELRSHDINNFSEKARRPLAVVVNGAWRAFSESDKPDLRIIYEHVVTTFKNEKSTQKT